jgi:hypothetical protein
MIIGASLLNENDYKTIESRVNPNLGIFRREDAAKATSHSVIPNRTESPARNLLFAAPSAEIYFFNSARQFVTSCSGPWASSSEWFTSTRFPSDVTSNATPIPGEAA